MRFIWYRGLRLRAKTILILTPLFVIFSHYLAVFPHEFTHSFFAWALGYKTNPFDIQYGGTSPSNLLLLSNIDENVDYERIFQNNPFHVALIALSGPFIANGLLFIFSYWLLQKKAIQQKPYLYYFIFWFNIMNIANLYDYVPLRTFAGLNWDTDMSNLERGLGISPWVVYIVGGYLMLFLFWQFFTKTLVEAYVYLNIKSAWVRSSLLIAVVSVLFVYFGRAGLHGYGEISTFVSATSMIFCPAVIFVCWPQRLWVREKIDAIGRAISAVGP